MAKTKTYVNVKNRKAFFDYTILDKFSAGIKLLGTEIKSIRNGHVTLKDAYCIIDKGEVFVKNLNIEILKNAGANNHDPKRLKQLLLNKKEIEKLEYELKNKGITLVATRLFTNERGLAKLEIALAKGKKDYDKRDTIKKRDVEREIKRNLV